MSNPQNNNDLVYKDPDSIDLTRGERLSNLWNRVVAKVKRQDSYPQIGLLPTGEKGVYTVAGGGHLDALDRD